MQRQRVSLALVQPDQMEAELRGHRRRERSGDELAGGILERLHEAALWSLAERAPLAAREGIVRLALRDFLEFRAVDDLGPDRLDLALRVGAVGRRRSARDLDQRDDAPALALELLPVGIEVLLDFSIRHLRSQFLRHHRLECHERNLGGVVRVAPSLPKPGVGEKDVAGDLLEQLLLRDLRAIVGLELGQEAL